MSGRDDRGGRDGFDDPGDPRSSDDAGGSGGRDAGTGPNADPGPNARTGAKVADGGGGTASGGRFDPERAVDYLMWAGVAVLAVTALVALFGFYTGVTRAISVWVTREFRPLVNAAFNLALLLAALGGIGLLLRRRG